MSRLQQQVAEFHRALGQDDPTTPTDPEWSTRVLRARLIAEESAGELLVALVGASMARELCEEQIEKAVRKRGGGIAGDLPEIVDACADSSVVIAGTMSALGVNDDPIHNAVMRANMAKVGGGKDANGKFQKPPGWQPPAIEAELIAQGWVKR